MSIPYSGKLSREKTFANFEVREPSAKVFSTKFWGMPHPLMFGFKQSVKVFSVKFSLPTDPQKFSPSKVYCYTVCESLYLADVSCILCTPDIIYIN